jgi:transcriptional regulator with XRE-family HTH domain
MTQRDLAKASGISVPQIARYETGVSKPRMTALVKLAKALSVDVSQLEHAADEPEMSEITIVSDGGLTTPCAIPKSRLEWLEANAQKHGVTLDVMLAAVINHAYAKSKDPAVTFEDVLAKTVEELQDSPVSGQVKE